MEHPSRLNADLAYEVDDVPVLRFIRDYALPLLVWLFMMRFLCGQVIVPLFTSGMITQLRRKPQQDGSDDDSGDGEGSQGEGENAAVEDESEPQFDGDPAPTAAEKKDQ